MNSFEIVFYKTSNNICPVKDFLLDTDIKMRAKISSLMEILEEYGNLLREPYSKYLRDGIFELRCQSGNNISRILYCDNKIIMTNGFIKRQTRHLKKKSNWQN